MAKTDTQISVRITNEFKARLERQAEKERRSVSNLIIKVMEEYLERYRADCLTIGRAVTLENGRRGRASGVDEDFRLIVTYPGGARDYINAGQVSVRGLAGYL